MKTLRRLARDAALGAFLVLTASASANAAVIEYQAVDLIDDVVGQDLWRYEYFVSGFVFGIDQGFSVYFDPALTANLQDPPPAVDPDWSIIAVQPDTALPSDGFYDARALVSAASLDQPFILTFVWLGGAGNAPGSQEFSLNQFVGEDISFLDTGDTVRRTSSVSEPPTLLFLGLGLALAGGARRRHLGRARSR